MPGFSEEKENYPERASTAIMGDEEDDLLAFLQRYGFSPDELDAVLHEIEGFRSIPGTTLHRYMNRVISTIEEDDRPAFLKGVLLGTLIRGAVQAQAEISLTEEEKRIDREIERLGFGR